MPRMTLEELARQLAQVYGAELHAVAVYGSAAIGETIRRQSDTNVLVLVDTLDLAIPPGPTKPVDPAVRAKNYLAFPYPYARTKRPTNRDTKPGTPSAGATPTSNDYQLTIIGGFTDGFRFYPITVDGNTATIHPHHDLLEAPGKSPFASPP